MGEGAITKCGTVDFRNKQKRLCRRAKRNDKESSVLMDVLNTISLRDFNNTVILILWAFLYLE